VDLKEQKDFKLEIKNTLRLKSAEK